MNFVYIFVTVFFSFWLFAGFINLGIRIGYNIVKRTLEPEAQLFTLFDLFIGLLAGPFFLGLKLGSTIASLGLTFEEPEDEK